LTGGSDAVAEVIIKVEDKKSSRQKGFEEVKDYIKGTITRQLGRKGYEEWIAKLKADSKVEKRQVKGNPE
jgi:parvulin-like peptidyl-prolyl isomerase